MLTGDVNTRYLFGGRTVFRPGVAARAGAASLRLATAVDEALERQLDAMTKEPPNTADRSSMASSTRWLATRR